MDVDWSELPIDIIQLIFERLIHISDHNQFSLVCSSWRSLALQHRRRCFPPDIPGLLIPGQNCNTSCQTRRFLPSPIGKEIIDQTIHVQNNNEQLFLPLLPIPHENLCRGSYEDWLVMVEKNISMYLLNPFSGTRIDLPPVNALPRPPMFVARPKSKWYINKVILSARPSSSSSSSSTEDEDCIVMVFYRDNDLAFCKLGEKKVWRVFNDCAEEFDDGIFYKNSFVFVDPCGEVFICNDIESMQPQITFLAGTPPRIFPSSSKWYLVESSAEGGDDLLIIYKGSYHELDNDERCSNRVVDAPREQSDSENDDVDEFDYDNEYKGSKAAIVQKTTTFIIFKLDTTSGSTSPTWVEVKNLDGQALFLGLNQSFSLCESHIQAHHAAGYKSNRIYFSDDDIFGHKLRLISGNNMGIFNLEDSTIEPLYLIDSDSTKPPAVWLTPKPWSWSKS